jgi:transcriptional regulator NrdR family protein
MICPVCGGENFKVIDNVKRGETCDLRNRLCLECKTLFIEKSELTDIYVSGEAYNLRKAKERNVIEHMSEIYIQDKLRKRNNA